MHLLHTDHFIISFTRRCICWIVLWSYHYYRVTIVLAFIFQTSFLSGVIPCRSWLHYWKWCEYILRWHFLEFITKSLISLWIEKQKKANGTGKYLTKISYSTPVSVFFLSSSILYLVLTFPICFFHFFRGRTVDGQNIYRWG